MRVVIIEDEAPAAQRLIRMLQALPGSCSVVQWLDSVEESVRYLSAAPEIDLLFMDIQLADGVSFSIFDQVQVDTPVIFTTAFDQYTLKAFKVNSVDYLLKPIDEQELRLALEKFRRLSSPVSSGHFRERLLIKRGRQLHYLRTLDTAYCYADGKICYGIDFQKNSYILEHTLSELETLLSPQRFFRANRHLLVNIDAVRKIHTWLGGRLKLELHPPVPGTDGVVSRERVGRFKDWLGS
ncbi:LytR/AlgR family response regulator transcription factor [Dinghuibacter silviterrae]|uniref:LytTR family two component transcriptional regulator n=1 Tax=Dinghuibacter silviterrae TaxID=1539049 RepID=A0A4R8DUG3_9BACT|nr:LytTR family DNA-binding domain-containing protein [Dinghuibacter silviterrae]TDX02014.1 LytTR family two component transcriptional regulator [Dinghuibacter silviterrae]